MFYFYLSDLNDRVDYKSHDNWMWLSCMLINSLAPGRCGSIFKSVNSEHILGIKFMVITWEIGLFDVCLNKRLGKKSRRWCFGTPSRSLWRHCNVNATNTIDDKSI